MKKYIFLFAILLFTIQEQISAQNSVQLADIELVNLGDGQLYGHKRDENKTPIEGKVRIITGFTTEYIDADFLKGIATGKWEYYKKNNLISYISYKDGYMNGDYAELNPSGTPVVTGSYKNGKKDGKWKTYSMMDNLKDIEIFNEGNLVKRTQYYISGTVKAERNFVNKKEHGVSTTYDQDGTLLSKKNYIDGKQVGKQLQVYITATPYSVNSNYSDKGVLEGDYREEYIQTQKPKTVGQYKNDSQNGIWKYYDQNGKLVKENTYENGILKSSTNHDN